MGGTRDQSFHGLHRPEQQHTRPVVHKVESQVSETIPAIVQDTEPVLHHEFDIDDDTVSLVAGPGGEDPVWNEFESMFSDVPDSVVGEGVVPQEEDPVPVDDITPGRVLREALESFDGVDFSALIRCRAVVMKKSPPKFLRGAFKSVTRFALEEANVASRAHDERRQCRAWKLFLLAPRMVLFRRARGGLFPKNNCGTGVRSFCSWRLGRPLRERQEAAEEATTSRCRRRRTQVDSIERRAERAQALVGDGRNFFRSVCYGRRSNRTS